MFLFVAIKACQEFLDAIFKLVIFLIQYFYFMKKEGTQKEYASFLIKYNQDCFSVIICRVRWSEKHKAQWPRTRGCGRVVYLYQ